MTKQIGFLVLLSFAVFGCDVTVPVAPCDTDSGPMVGDAGMPDSGTDAAVDPTIRDFRLTVLTNPVMLVAGESSMVEIRVERAPGYTRPILLTPWGLPDGVDYLSRENRPGEDITVLVYHVSEDGVGPFSVPNYVIQGDDGTGLRESTPARYEVP